MSCFAVAGVQPAVRSAAHLHRPRRAPARRGGAVVTRAGGDARRQRQGTKVTTIASDGAVGRRVMLGLGSVGALLGRGAAGAWAQGEDALAPKDYSNYNSGSGDDNQSDLVKRLLAKSADNKAKNDAERYNYDKQYATNLAIIKGTGYVPEDQATRDKMGITRPPECDLPFFKDSPTCQKF